MSAGRSSGTLIRDKGLRARLYGLMRYASAKGIAPEAVTDAVLEAYLRYRAETTALGAGVADFPQHRAELEPL